LKEKFKWPDYEEMFAGKMSRRELKLKQSNTSSQERDRAEIFTLNYKRSGRGQSGSFSGL